MTININKQIYKYINGEAIPIIFCIYPPVRFLILHFRIPDECQYYVRQWLECFYIAFIWPKGFITVNLMGAVHFTTANLWVH